MADLDDARRREIARIRAEYARRERTVPVERYSADNPGHRLLMASQEQAMTAALARARLLPLDGRRGLEIGCGAGRWLGFLAGLGAPRDRLLGLDIDLGRLHAAKSAGTPLLGDAARMPFASGSFDLVLQSTVMTSILEPAVRRAVGREMLRVVRADGALLWYDFRVDNPRNPHVRGVPRSELRALFPGCTIDARRTTLAPPVARFLAPRLPRLARLLDRTRLLATHDLAVIRPARERNRSNSVS